MKRAINRFALGYGVTQLAYLLVAPFLYWLANPNKTQMEVFLETWAWLSLITGGIALVLYERTKDTL
jgi:hypothetical protein